MKSKNTLGSLLLTAFLLFSLPAYAAVTPKSAAPDPTTQKVTLAWNKNPEAFVTGYRVYCGTASRTYTKNVDAKAELQATVLDLGHGTTYFLAVTAYTATGVESGFSDEVTFKNTLPTIPALTDAVISPGTSTVKTFAVGDAETAPGLLLVRAYSDNELVLPSSCLSISGAGVGTGTSRTLTISNVPTPASPGLSATVTVKVADNYSFVERSFVVSFVPRPSAPTGVRLQNITLPIPGI